MSETDYSQLFQDDDDEFVSPGDVVGQLRKALKAQQRINKALEKERDDLKVEIGGLKTTVTKRTLAELLESEGAKPTLAKYMDGVEATKEAVAAWLAENGDDFGYDPKAKDAAATKADEKPAGQADDKQVVVPDGQQPANPELDAILASMQKVQNQEANAAPGISAGDDQMADFLARVGQNATSFEDVENALRQAGLFNQNGR